MAKFIRSVDKNYIEIAGERKHETQPDNPNGGAILFYDGKKEVWIPKSQIEGIEDHGKNNITITIPEWLAEEKGLI